MTDETQTPQGVSAMVRTTAENTGIFMQQIANHIDTLEQVVLDLQKRVAELEGTQNAPQ